MDPWKSMYICDLPLSGLHIAIVTQSIKQHTGCWLAWAVSSGGECVYLVEWKVVRVGEEAVRPLISGRGGTGGGGGECLSDKTSPRWLYWGSTCCFCCCCLSLELSSVLGKAVRLFLCSDVSLAWSAIIRFVTWLKDSEWYSVGLNEEKRNCET